MSDESVPDPNVSEIVVDLDGLDALTGATAQGPTRRDERRLADLTAANARAEGQLRAKGVQLGEQQVTSLQVRTLLRLIVGDDPEVRMQWNLAYQESVAEGLAEVAEDLAKRQQASRLVLPGAPIPNLNGR